MASRIEFNFSYVFEGIVWNMLASSKNDLLVVEVRDQSQRKVTFSALNCLTGDFRLQDLAFDEPWWISLGATADEFVLFTMYVNTDNPDKKGIFSYHLLDRKMVWWNNDFSLVSVSHGVVEGVSTQYGTRSVFLDLVTGMPVDRAEPLAKTEEEVVRPQQYLDDNAYFSTVKTFLNRKFNLLPVIALEYLEYDSNIFISFYVQETTLANYLFIISAEGEVLMKQKLGDGLKGIGLDTFFVLSGCVIFVKNKVELFSYKLV